MTDSPPDQMPCVEEGMVHRLALIIDGEAWAAIADGRDGPDTLWSIRREFALNKAEAVIRELAKPTEAMLFAGGCQIEDCVERNCASAARHALEQMLGAALDRPLSTPSPDTSND